MRLLNKLSTGAYRFKATPVEAVRVGLAHIRATFLIVYCIGGRGLAAGHMASKSVSTHLASVSKEPGKAMQTGDAQILRACRSSSAELPTLPLPQRQVAFEVSTSILEETCSARGPSLAHAQYFQKEDRCVPPCNVNSHLLTAMPCMHQCK